MIMSEAPSYPVSIFIAGNRERACEEAQAYCDQVGFCVTVSATEYVYRGGSESGVVVGLINYPRFPSKPDAILAHAKALGERLRVALQQDSFSIQTPDKTIFVSYREQPPPPPTGAAWRAMKGGA